MDGTGSRWYDDSSKRCGMASLLEIKTPESEENFIWSIINGICNNQTKVIESTTEVRLNEPAHASTGHERESIDENGRVRSRKSTRGSLINVGQDLPMMTRTISTKTQHNVAMQKLSADDETQHEKNLPNLLKNKHQFRDETKKDILYNYEIEAFAELYNLTNVLPVLSCYDSIFWLKDSDGVIYIWNRTNELMIRLIRGECDMKEALENYLFTRKIFQPNCFLVSVPNNKTNEDSK
ncbi:unnamed protein product [Rhizophagus irregularis]|nr:unnamed protein product [Rhizophagus irregularis]